MCKFILPQHIMGTNFRIKNLDAIKDCLEDLKSRTKLLFNELGGPEDLYNKALNMLFEIYGGIKEVSLYTTIPW